MYPAFPFPEGGIQGSSFSGLFKNITTKTKFNSINIKKNPAQETQLEGREQT